MCFCISIYHPSLHLPPYCQPPLRCVCVCVCAKWILSPRIIVGWFFRLTPAIIPTGKEGSDGRRPNYWFWGVKEKIVLKAVSHSDWNGKVKHSLWSCVSNAPDRTVKAVSTLTRGIHTTCPDDVIVRQLFCALFAAPHALLVIDDVFAVLLWSKPSRKRIQWNQSTVKVNVKVRVNAQVVLHLK